jgi:hypothetical protein
VLRKWVSRIWKLLCVGWRAFKEAHAIRFLFELSGITLPAGLFTAILAYSGEHSVALLTITCAVLLTLFTAMLFLFLGYRRESRSEHNSSSAVSSPSITIPDFSQIIPRFDPSYISVADAIKYIADEADWGIRLRAAPPNAAGMRQMPRLAAIDEFVRAARAGQIAVYGRLDRTGEHRLISQQYWLYATVEGGQLFAPNQAGSTIPIMGTDRQQRENFICYDALCVERSEISSVWPRPDHAWMAS